MAGEFVMGIDVGSYSTKGVLCRPDGEIVATHVVEHTMSVPRPGWAEHDAETVWWHGCVAVCRGLLAASECDPTAVRALAVSGIGPAVLPIDARGRPLRPAILYGIDTRAGAEIAELTARCGESAILSCCGSALTTQAPGPKILWLRRHEPEVFQRAAYFLGATSYLLYRLSGEIVMDRYTASSYTPFFDLRGGAWTDRFAEPICSLERLPPLRGSAEVAGTVGARAAEETGLVAGTPVTAGTIDAMAEAISVGVVQPGELMLMYGTTTFFILVTAAPVLDSRLWGYGHALPGRYALAAGVSTSGALTRWLRDVAAPDLLAGERAGGLNAYQALAQEAAAIPPGSRGLLMLPYFSGERTPINDPEARGVIAGLTLAHTRAHLYRAALEAVAYGVRQNLEVMDETGATVSRIVAVGGGTKNPLWLQIVSDVAGVRQEVPAQTIGAAYGDAFLAALAVGLVPGLDALTEGWVQMAQRVEPDAQAHQRYSRYYQLYLDLYRSTAAIQHTLSALSEAGAL